MRNRFYVALLMTCLISATGYAQKVTTDYDKQANFSSYKTYTWAEGTPAKNPLSHQRILAGIEAQLAAKGWQKVDTDPDVVVIYSAATSTKTQINTFETGGPWGGYRWGWGGYRGGMGTSTTTVQEIPVGELVVDMADVRNKSFIWRGTARDTLSDKPEKNQKKLDKALAKMFKSFPPVPGKK
ncbi:MAG: DUF4136 domain-containing protein [Pyrinomonadaceae bacterium]|nr:DUF4136 domain-containing protein [Pyrinomonadaceae bacterium]